MCVCMGGGGGGDILEMESLCLWHSVCPSCFRALFRRHPLNRSTIGNQMQYGGVYYHEAECCAKKQKKKRVAVSWVSCQTKQQHTHTKKKGVGGGGGGAVIMVTVRTCMKITVLDIFRTNDCFATKFTLIMVDHKPRC